MTDVRRTTGAVGLACVVGMLGGCADPGPVAPAVVWVDGAPSGELEDDPWVVAAREGDLAMAVATNANDFTGDELEAAVNPYLINQIGSFRESGATYRWYFLPGPTPMVVQSVHEEQDGWRGVVRVCEAAEWYVDAEQPEPPAEPRGQIREYEVIRSPSTGERWLNEVNPVTGSGECSLEGAAVGLFDPQPDPSATYAPEDVERP